MVDQSSIPGFNASTVPPQDAATLERLHTWIEPTEYRGTSQWLFDSPVFQQWYGARDHGILWIRGVPGVGKSVLAARLVRHLNAEQYPVFHFFFRHSIESNHRPEAALRDWIAQSLPSSPALQLELKNLALEHKDVASVDQLTVTDLWHLLNLALGSIPRAYFVVDALDEMDQDVIQDFLHLLDQLGNSNPGRVKLIITSRPIPLVEKTVRNIKVIDIRLNNDQVSPDIFKYLRHRVDGVLPTLGNHEAIVSKVLEKAGDVFLYAKLAMDTLCEQEVTSHQQMLDVIDKAPLNLSMMYGNLIREHMERTGLPEGLNILVLQLVTYANRPLRLLEISDCIKVIRPDYTQDIATMKNIVRTSCGPLLEVLPDETVRVVHHSLTEYLLGLNRSPSDKDIPVFEPAHTHNAVALLCLSYLQAGCLDTLEYDRQKQRKNPQMSPFISYAATNWHVHIAKSSAQGFPQEEANEAILSLLMTPQNSKKLALLLRSKASDDEQFWEELSSFVNQEEGKALLIALHLDLSSFSRYLADRIDMKTAGNIGSSRLHPPLHSASIRGNLDMVRLLISKGVSISHYNARGYTALHEALRVKSISYAIVKYLLDVGADPWQRERNSDENPLDVSIEGKNHKIDDEDVQLLASNPPIESAFSYGDEQVAELFLPHIKSEKAARYAFLRVLTNSKRPEIMRKIVDLGIMELNSPIFGDTLLLTACTHLVPDAVKLLLDAGADPNFPRDEIRINPVGITTEGGANVLHGLAAPAKYGGVRREIPEDRLEACFALVFAAGANVTQVDDEGMTPLHKAMTPLAAKLLLDAGADPFALDKNGLTPLDVAYSVDVAEVLLAKTDINTRRHNGRTVLLQTLYKEDYRITPTDDRSKLEMALNLLDLGVNPRISDSDGNGPLHYLTKIGVEHKPDAIRLLERLVQAGVDVNLRNNRGQTALHTLNYRDYIWAGTDSFKPLLALPAVDVNAADENGYTFLFNAISLSGNIIKHEFVDLMVQTGAYFNATDIRGRTLLHVFLKHIRSDVGPDDEMMKLLVEKGADPRQTDREGDTLWHEAARTFSGRRLVWPKVFHTITALGVDPRQRNNRGKTPLHVMCEHDQEALRDQFRYPAEGNPTLFQYIVQQNHDGINEPDDEGIVPLHTLSTFSTDLTERLLEAGADATLATREGLNVFHLASRGRQSNVIGVLIDWFKAKRNTEQLVNAVNAKDERGRGPLYYACASGRYQSVDLLIKAGAVPVLDTYENSALQGLVEFEEELKNWRNGTDYPGAGATLVNEAPTIVSQDRIDDILNLFINTATSSNWQGIDHAIIAAANRQHDYTVESLLRARMSLGLLAPPPSPPEVQACLQRRTKLLASTLETRHADHGFSSQVVFMIAERLYDAIPSYIQDYSPKPESAYFYEVLLELSLGGHASLLDDLLTPEVISDLERDTGSMEEETANERRQDLSSLLAAACMSKQPNLHVIKLLMQKGAKADKIVVGSGHPTTALHILVENSQHRWWQTAQALPYILERGVDFEVRINGGLTPLRLSLEHLERPSWRVRATKMLLQAGANPSSVDGKGKSCLAHAVGHDSVFQLLLSHGAVLDPTTMASAILARDVKTIEMMLESGADPNSRKVGFGPSHRPSADMTDPYDETGLYPLDLLVTSRGFDHQDETCVRILDLLFQHGADPNGRYPDTSIAHRVLGRKTSDSDYTPFKLDGLGLRRNYSVDMILEHPLLEVNAQDAEGTLLLHVAYRFGDMKSTKRLMKRGAAIRARDNWGRNILHQSPNYNYRDFDADLQLQLLEALITSAPELLQQADKDGRTPLHCAISRRASKEEIELFISKGADVHAKDTSGNTALHLLFKEEWNFTVNGEYLILDERKLQVINHLVSKGLDVNARNKAGETAVFNYFREGALRLRTSQGEEVREVDEALRRQNINTEDSITLEKEQVLWELFYEWSVDWTIFNNERQSLLHIVAAKSVSNEGLKSTRLLRFEFLMGQGLDVHAEDSNGRTALDIAAAVGAEDILTHFKAD
ncbi:hypothetical protein NW752_010382 [Fusarium irregulare]|uniref:NACHT domain-containing protein n=1 Tax=Fusarium irregulare TaxID=2494466 RepID=A0A9W8PIG3_9HYPO|nr:hypothetical protein NW752_010382 [Fusarium irregulare]KAJ4008019.1 hypothetical protein NW766_009834 [Fusarium irregulare]